MKNFFLALVFLFSVSFTSFSQNTQPTPKPADEDDVVKIYTTLIQLDVAVTDEKGNVVKDLKPEDFEIYENGKKQDVTNFSFVSAGSETTEAAKKPDKSDKLAVPLPPSNIKPEQIRRTIALVVDDLTLSFESVYYVRRALKKFVDQQMQDGDLVAIIRTGGGIGALQQFTSDKRMLYAAIEKIRWNLTGTGLTGAFAPYTPDPLENIIVTMDQSAEKNAQTKAINDKSRQVQKERAEATREFSQRANEFRTNSFVTGTLGAVGYVVRGMKDLPGRKSIMLLSDGFEIFDGSNEGIGESGIILERLRKLVDEANRSSVVIYSLDARGVQTLGFTAEDSFIGESYQDDLTDPRKQQGILADRRAKFFNTQTGLVFLSRETGGFPILNSNDLGGGIRKVLNDQSYYLIGYQPDEATFDPKTRRFNKIEIKVKRDNLTVRYRSGFFGVSDEQIKKPAANQTPYQQISAALTSPFAVNDINLSLNTVFKADSKSSSSVSSFLYISIKDLKFSDEPNGEKKAVFDILAMSFGDNGIVTDQLSKTFTINLKKENYQKLLNEGFIYNFTFPIKKPGAYQMRVAIRDHATEKVGSASKFIEVPNLKKDRLTLSDLILENLPFEQYSRQQQVAGTKSGIQSDGDNKTDPVADTTRRKFKRGTVLRYGFEIYNAKSSGGQKPQMQIQTRVFRDGKLLFTGESKPVDVTRTADAQIDTASGAMNLGTDLQPGDYVLQIIVTDASAKEKNKIAAQFAQFEIIE